MKNKKYKHSTTARMKPVSLRLRVAMATQGWAHTSLNRRLTAYLRILWENGQYVEPVEELSIYVLVPHATYILVLRTVFEQHDAEVPEVRVYRYLPPILTLAWWLGSR